MKDITIPADRLAQLAGVYEFSDIGIDSDVTTEDGKLFLQAKKEGQQKFRLQWQGGDEFRADFDPKVKVVFAADGKSLKLFQGRGVYEGKRKP